MNIELVTKLINKPKEIPSHPELTKEELYYIILAKSENFNYIKNPSEELQLEAVKRNGYAIEFIDNPSEAVQLEAVKQNGVAIQYIKNPSEEVCLEALKSSFYSHQYISDESFTDNVLKAYILNGGNVYRKLKLISKSEKMKLFAIVCDGYNIKHIDNPTDDMKKLAVNVNGKTIRYINNPSEELCIQAIENNFYAYSNLMASQRTNKVNEKFLELYPEDFDKINNPSEELCLKAIELNFKNYTQILSPSHKITVTLLEKNPKNLKFIKKQTTPMCLEMVKKDGLVLQYVKRQTKKICLAAVEQNPEAFEYVKDKFRTTELKTYVIEKCPKMIKTFTLEDIKQSETYIKLALVYRPNLISQLEQTEENCLICINSSPNCLRYISEKAQTTTVCLDAIKKDPEAAEHIKNKNVKNLLGIS